MSVCTPKPRGYKKKIESEYVESYVHLRKGKFVRKKACDLEHGDDSEDPERFRERT